MPVRVLDSGTVGPRSFWSATMTPSPPGRPCKDAGEEGDGEGGHQTEAAREEDESVHIERPTHRSPQYVCLEQRVGQPPSGRGEGKARDDVNPARDLKAQPKRPLRPPP